MHIRILYFFVFIAILNCGLVHSSYAQCLTPINVFPYDEDFETTDGGWAPGSTTHWEWGQIVSKPVITAAGGGQKCWLVGGFSGSSYNSGSSYLQSPCFDISSLSVPEVSFKVFWETERRYDGALFQFTTDAGATWLTLGSINSNSNCQGENWYNYDPVNFLSGPGWSGNIQSTAGSCVGGGGSGRWLTARHSLAIIAGVNKVSFRFVFAAGLTCNNFDGFGVDDIHIGEAAPNGANYSYTCGANKSVDFTSTSSGCKTSILWDFNDPPSGAANSSTADNPNHIFSAPGNYTVTLTTNFATGPSLVIAQTIHVISLTAVIDNPIKCNGDHTGAVSVNVNPAGIYTYSWDTSPPQNTPSINNLAAGIYTVTVTGTATCSTSIPVTLTEPDKLVLTTNISDAKCGSPNGSVSTNVTGGIPIYNYVWSNSAVSPSISNLVPGTYSLSVTDANGCNVSANGLQVKSNNTPLVVSLGKDTGICPGQKLVLTPGNFATYKWQDNSASSTFNVTATGIYSVNVTDASGCTGSASIKVTVDCSEIYFPSAFTPNSDFNNDEFGPLPPAALASIHDYNLTVYGRWGEVVFTSTDPFKKWDGRINASQPSTQTFTWVATYRQNNRPQVFKKGTVSIIR